MFYEFSSKKMNIKFLQIFVCVCCYLLLSNCKHIQYSTHLQEGDLLFQHLRCGELCDAIDTVTEGIHGKDFSHCALVVSINDTLKVIEAIDSQVQVTSLANFFARSADTSEIKNITVGRLKHQYKKIIPLATTRAKQLIGQPYDHEFVLNNGKWYCSELIYEVFKSANNQKDFFALEPMTFKDIKNQTFVPAWEEYFKKLRRSIPEGELGINPGLISRSDKITIIKITEIPEK